MFGDETVKRAYRMNGQTECRACDLRARCTQVVAGAGSIFARIAFVGEAPGADEDRQGLPFVGKAGKAITSLLQFLDVKREDVFITNTVKCRPITEQGTNGKPKRKEINACSVWLITELALVQPRIIVALGGYALDATTKKGDKITGYAEAFATEEETLKSRHAEWQDAVVVPFFHPAALFYPGAGDKKRMWIKASQNLKTLCASLMIDEEPDADSDPTEGV